MDIHLTLQPRARVDELIEKYAAAELTFGDLQREIAALGYSTVSTYEMVRHITPKKR